VQIVWDEVCNGPDYATYYNVWRATSEGGTKTSISGWQTELGFEDTEATPGTPYTYWVQAAPFGDGSGAGDYSDPDTGWR